MGMFTQTILLGVIVTVILNASRLSEALVVALTITSLAVIIAIGVMNYQKQQARGGR